MLSTRSRLFVSTLIASSTASWTLSPANAQDAAPSPAPADIVVTGSRVHQGNANSVSPITSVSAEQIRLQGSSKIEDILNTLPSISPSESGQVNGLGNGTATVDLRQLGPSRTLVLVDNIRLMPGDPITPAPDLNNIPTSLVQRIDVLTGGASTVYGSDAVAGVVNFVLKHNFEGVAVDGSLGFYEHDNDSSIQGLVKDTGETPRSGTVVDGLTKNINVTVGMNSADGRGNVTAYMGYRQTNPVGWGKRDFSNCIVQSDASGHYCGGSAGTAPALIIPANGDLLTIDSGTGLLRSYTSSDAYNYAPTNVLQRADSRYTAGAMARYEVTPALKLHADFMFMQDKTIRQLAPDGVYNTFNVSCGNPQLTADEVETFCTSQGLGASDTTPITVYRRNVEGGARHYRIEHTSFRGVIGAQGDIDPVWSYDVYGLYARTKYTLSLDNTLAVSRANKAMDVVADPTTGQAVCASVLDGSDPSCIPYNPWTIGGVTQSALDYLTINAYQSGSTTEKVLSASLSGKLGQYGIKSPWADNGATIAIGAEYRKESLDLETDSAFSSGDVEGTVVQGNSGSFHVGELFTELRVPLLENKPFFKELAFEGGFRRSDYNTAGTANTYKLGLEWAPSDLVRFRGSYNRAVRAPNLVELFTLQSRETTPTQDPCAGSAPTATLEQCARSGVTAAQYGSIVANPSGQYTALMGGNENLKPEIADTYTIGAVFTPKNIVPGLNISVDYFNIKVKNYITTIAGALSLNQCIATGNPTYCDLIHRDPTSGSLWIGNDSYIDGRETNAGSLKTSGIDFAINYMRPLGSGQIGLVFNGTWLQSRESEPLPGVSKYDCAGYFGTTCGQPSPDWRHQARVTWYSPFNVDLSVNWRYIGSVKSDRLIEAIGGSIPDVDSKIKSFNYFDLAAIWTIKSRYSLNLSVNNVFDRTPPIIGANYIYSYSNGGTYPGVYDMLGRTITVGFNVKF